LGTDRYELSKLCAQLIASALFVFGRHAVLKIKHDDVGFVWRAVRHHFVLMRRNNQPRAS
jgi:hypothetical protein